MEDYINWVLSTIQYKICVNLREYTNWQFLIKYSSINGKFAAMIYNLWFLINVSYFMFRGSQIRKEKNQEKKGKIYCDFLTEISRFCVFRISSSNLSPLSINFWTPFINMWRTSANSSSSFEVRFLHPLPWLYSSCK